MQHSEQGRVIEHAVLPVTSGREAEFEASFAQATSIIASMPGFRGLTLSRGFEHSNTYLLRVKWNSVDDHEIGFRGSPEYQQWKDLLHEFYEAFPVVEHFTEIVRVAESMRVADND